MPQVMQGHGSDDLDSSDDDDHFPPAQAFVGNETSTNKAAAVTAKSNNNPNQTKANKFDQLLSKVSQPSSDQLFLARSLTLSMVL